MADRPRLVLISTGGTIAGQAASAADTTGYQAGALDPAALLAAVPGHEQFASVSVSPLMAIDSKDMTPRHWLLLARAITTHLARADCDGVVVTHGTDTLEETAWLLHLLIRPGKPVVLTAAMRPATALSADGPMNLYQAIAVASHPESHGQGILVVLNDRVFAGAEIVKTHTSAIDAIAAPDTGPIGSANPVHFRRRPNLDTAGIVPDSALTGVDELPRVDILYAAAGSPADLLADAGHRGAAGVVLALPGNGSLPDTWRDAAEPARRDGVRVVRASRTGAGTVSPMATEQEAQAFPGSGRLSPVKARIALMLEIATGDPHLLTSCC